jgi:hypothetical protein
MNDSTHLNPSDPNSMFDQGETRNCVYNMLFNNQPDGSNTVYSKALGVHDLGQQNNTFYSFGAKFTNISDHFAENGYKTPTTFSSKRCNSLNKTMSQI